MVSPSDMGGAPFTVITLDISSRPDSDGDGVPDDRDNAILKYNPDQRDTDSDGYGNVADADLNNDLFVDSLDLGLFKQRFLGNDPHADFNGDGIVDSRDLGLFKGMFLKPPGPSSIDFANGNAVAPIEASDPALPSVAVLSDPGDGFWT